MKNLLILFVLTGIFSCGENRILISNDEIIYLEDAGSIYYELYKTGIDNYVYEFKVLRGSTRRDLFKLYLNDATYRKVKFKSSIDNDDTISILFNWPLQYEKDTHDLLKYKIKLRQIPVNEF